MKRNFTLCMTLALLTSMVTQAQTFTEYNSVSEDYGSITTLTSDDVRLTSSGFSIGDYNSRAAVVLGDKYIFSAKDASSGDELWVTDGTQGGTMIVLDIEPGEDSSSPENLIVVGDKVYFAATTSGEGTELWVTDGTADGTNLVIDLYVGAESSSPNTITPFKDGFLFVGIDLSSSNYDGDGVSRQQMWFSDGTSEGTERLSADNSYGVVPKTDGDAEGLSYIQVIGDTLAIFGGTSDMPSGTGTLGEEIWVTNGTPEPWGTKMLVDINGPGDDSNIQWMRTANEKQVIFRARTPGSWIGRDDLIHLNNEYWVTDGTTKGTYLLDDFNSTAGDEPNTTANTGSATPYPFDGKMYYRGNSGFGTELNRMNDLAGGEGSLELVKDIAPANTAGGEESSFIDDLIAFDGKLFFKGDFVSDNADFYTRSGRELGVFDPATDDVQLVADIFPGATTNSFPRNKTIVNGKMYMTANTGDSQASHDIWVLDIVGDGDDPVVPEADNLSLLPEYLCYRVFDDVDGQNQRLQTNLENLNGNLVFGTIDSVLVVFDDGLTKSSDPVIDLIAQGPQVSIGGNEYLDAPPTVSLTSPAAGSIFVESDEITLSVSAIDPEGVGVVKVEYYQGDFFNTWNKIGESTSGDFSVTWAAVAFASSDGGESEPFDITALAFDANDSSFSLPTQILVNGNTPPSVTITLPTAGNAEFEVGSTIEIAADASDDNAAGFVQVEFFANDELIWTDIEAPYGLEWTAPTDPQDIIITAVATDNLNASSESDPLTVTLTEEVLDAFASSTDRFVMYPIPATEGVLHIKNAFDQPVKLTITDLVGKLVVEESVNSGEQEIQVSNLKSGMYNVRVLNKAGENFSYQIIVNN